MAHFMIDLDDEFVEEIWHEMERIQDGCRSHKVIFTAGSKNAAAELIIYRLWGFFEDRLEEKDEKELIEDGYLN